MLSSERVLSWCDSENENDKVHKIFDVLSYAVQLQTVLNAS